MARGIVFSTERLRTLFEPRSIALVGASEKSTWSLMIHVDFSEAPTRAMLREIGRAHV